jgi:hypothetical protein
VDDGVDHWPRRQWKTPLLPRCAQRRVREQPHVPLPERAASRPRVRGVFRLPRYWKFLDGLIQSFLRGFLSVCTTVCGVVTTCAGGGARPCMRWLFDNSGFANCLARYHSRGASVGASTARERRPQVPIRELCPLLHRGEHQLDDSSNPYRPVNPPIAPIDGEARSSCVTENVVQPCRHRRKEVPCDE